MCGIAGIYNTRASFNHEGQLKAMADAIAHRGPDADGYYTDDKIGLAHRRLSIIDLSSTANQPMTSHDDRYVMVFNGEIYNYAELKSSFNDKQWTTGSDTEVLLELFVRDGDKAFSQLNGMFVVIVWDKLKKELTIARDRLGIKPVYYHLAKTGEFVFSSEVRSMLKTGLVPAELNEAALEDYLRYQTVHAPVTMLKDVSLLESGHLIKYNSEGFKIEKYWDIRTDYNEFDPNQSYQKTKSDTLDLLKAAVERRLIADVPFGAFLSGGIDSSAIVGLMSQIMTEPVKTFSVSFDEEEFSERVFAEMIAKKFKTDHTDIRLKLNDFLELIPDALSSIDHPSGDGPNTYVVSKVTKESGITVALSGLGGDELFAGYDVFKRMHRIDGNKWLKKIPRAFRKLGGEGFKAIRPGVSGDKMYDVLSQEKMGLESAYPISRRVLSDKQINSLLAKSPKGINAVAEIIKGIDELNIPILSKVSFAEINSYMQNVLLRDTDQMSMAHALEVRVPFLDHELLEYVFGVQDTFKYPHSPKKLLVDALGDLLPPEIVNRPKMGFVLPWANWLKSDLKEVAEKNLNYLSDTPYFNSVAINDLWSSFLEGDNMVSWSRVWPLIVLGNWMSENGVS